MRGGWLVGLLGVLVLAYITVNSLRTEGVGSRGPVVGEPLPPFAAPLAASDLEGDANVAGDACEVRGPAVMNVCELAADRPLVLAFVVPGVEQCERQIGVLDRVAPRFPGVAFAAVAVRGDREARPGARLADPGRPRPRRCRGERVRRRRLPVHHLRAARGEVAGSALTFLDEAALARRVEALRRPGAAPAAGGAG